VTDRPRYREGRRLDAGVLTAEQDYLTEGRRTHDRTAHGSGVAHGLGLTTAAAGVTIAPGVAVDGAGRSLVVPAPIRLPWADLPGDAAGLDLWLAYRETATADRIAAGVCVQVEVVTATAAAVAPPESAVYLGRLRRGDTGYVVEPGGVSYPDVVASTVAAPGVTLRLAAEPLLAVEGPGPARLAVTSSGTSVTGTLAAPDGRVAGPVRFGGPGPAPGRARPWRWYRTGNELRAEIATPAPTEVPEWSRFAVLTCSGSTPLAVDAGGTTTVSGDLTVEGPVVQAAAGPDPDDPRLRARMLGTWVDAVDVASRAVDDRFRGPAVDPSVLTVTLTPGPAGPGVLPYRLVVNTTGAALVTDVSVVATTTVDGTTSTATLASGRQVSSGQGLTLDVSVPLPAASSQVHVSAAVLGVLPGSRVAYASGTLDFAGPPPIH
jgi:hypothetical protein